MPVQQLDTVRTGPLAHLVMQGAISLWISRDATAADVQSLAGVPWVNVWNTNPGLDYAHVHEQQGSSRTCLVVTSVDNEVAEFSRTKFLRLYKLGASSSVSNPLLQTYREMQLKAQVATVVGVVAFVGSLEATAADIQLVRDLAPHVIILSLDPSPPSPSLALLDIFQWTSSIEHFRDDLVDKTGTAKSSYLDLKDAPNVEVDPELIEAIEESWTLLTSEKVTAAQVTQEAFDAFLNGDPEWTIFAAGGAYERKLVGVASAGHKTEQKTLSELVMAVVSDVEQSELDPRDPLRQLRVFAESGSGSTTSIRAAAMLIAQRGYPTLVSNPESRSLGAEALTRLVIHVQDRWRVARRGMGSGRGNIPVIIFLDKDIEEEREPHLERSLL